MNDKRKIEVFSAGCSVCEETIQLALQAASPSNDVKIMDMKDPDVAKRAKELGIHSVPAVVIDGKLVSSTARRRPDEEMMRAAKMGWPED